MQLLVLAGGIDEQADAQVVVGDVGNLRRMTKRSVMAGIDHLSDRERLFDAVGLLRLASRDCRLRTAHGVAG
jgi:hypothetical protein